MGTNDKSKGISQIASDLVLAHPTMLLNTLDRTYLSEFLTDNIRTRVPSTILGQTSFSESGNIFTISLDELLETPDQKALYHTKEMRDYLVLTQAYEELMRCGADSLSINNMAKMAETIVLNYIAKKRGYNTDGFANASVIN